MRRDETRASQSFFDKEEKKKQNKNVRLLLNFSLRSTVKTARLTSDRINRVCKLGISFWLVESLCSLLAFAGMLKISIFPSALFPTREMCSLCGVVELNLLELCCESWLYRRKFRLQILHFHFSSSARCEPFCCNFSWLALCVLCSNLHRQIVRISVTEKKFYFSNYLSMENRPEYMWMFVAYSSEHPRKPTFTQNFYLIFRLDFLPLFFFLLFIYLIVVSGPEHREFMYVLRVPDRY